MGTSLKRSSAFRGCLAQRAEAYDIEWDLINGEDLYEVRAKTHLAIDRARTRSSPSVLEIGTYRYYGHSIADANHKKYRTSEEIERYKKNHDPIHLWRARLLEEGVLDEARADELDKAAKEEAAAAVRFAEESPAPTVADIMTDVYWESDHDTAASKVGRHFFND
jgi:pyruvate dehydrogenase E1 component alpha subunit